MVSVVTVSRNAASTICGCLTSVAAQHLAHEYLIIDGVSTDGTLDIIERYRDGVTTVVSEPDKGIYDAMNKGLALATGEIVGTLNADDFYADDKVLEDVAKVFETPDVDCVYGDLEYVDARDTRRVVRRWMSGPYRRASFYNGWMPPHPTFFVRRKFYELYGGFNLALGTSADYELMLRFLLKHELRAAYIPRVLVKMRTGGASNVSLGARLRANRMDREAWRVNGLRPRPWTLVMKPLRKVGQFLP